MRKNLSLFLSIYSLLMFSQEKILGKITDENGSPIDRVSVLIDSKGNVISNDEGRFEIVSSNPIKHLIFSKTGYQDVNIENNISSPINVVLIKKATQIEEVIISLGANKILQKAIANIPINYAQKYFFSKEFRRSVLTEGDSIFYVQEMAVNVKRSYNPKLETKYYLDKNRIFNFTSDKILLKNIGGLDLIKNLGSFFNNKFYKKYHIQKLPSTIINNEEAYVIDFYRREPLKRLDFKGQLFINKKGFGIVKIDITWGDGDRLIGEYRKINGLYYMMSGKGVRSKNHSGVERISTIEMINTEISESIPDKIQGELVSSSDIISRYEVDYYDTDFWNNYNVVIPNKNVQERISKFMRPKSIR